MKKKEKLLRELNEIDDQYLLEADPARHTRTKRGGIYKWTALAACFCILTVTLSLWLFLPFRDEREDLDRYADSEYYDLILKLRDVTYTPLSFGNNFELLMDRIFSSSAEDVTLEGDMVANDADRAESAIGNGEYVEVTDNQVEGVIEGDLFKRTRDRVFYLRGNTLSVYSIEGKESRELGCYEIEPVFNAKGYYYYHNGEIFLSEDGRTVTLLLPHEAEGEGAQVGVISLDVSNPEKIQKKNEIRISGGYLSARSLDGDLLLMSEFSVGRNPDFSNEKEFIPQIRTKDGESSVPMKDILCPDTLTNARYTVVCRLNQESLELTGCSALLSYSREIYVSEESVYATRSFQKEESDGNGVTTQRTMTEINRLAFDGNGFQYQGAVTVSGSVLNQYSMDEYQGQLRVVTTTEEYKTRKTAQNGTTEMYDVSASAVNANLYLIDLADMTVKNSVEQFAPEGERVQSVRFDGTAAYVCTSIQLSDPVFFFDLTDPDHITWKDTGTIEGFSSSLVSFGDGYLLGIGRGDSWDTVKIEVYEEGADGVESVAVYESDRSGYSTDYKSYFIDRENRLVGLAISRYDYSYNYQCEYVLLSFNGYGLYKLLSLPASSDLASARAFIEDGFLYLFHADGFAVKAVSL